MPLIAAPGIEHPFSTPKLILLGIAVGIGMLCSVLLGQFGLPPLSLGLEIGIFAWLLGLALSAITGVFVSLSAFLLQLFAVGWCWLLLLWQPETKRLGLAMIFSGTIVAVLALLQFSGLDLFAFLGWTTPFFSSPRMRIFATLGNPNYVAAFLVAVLPFSFCLSVATAGRYSWPRWLWWVLLTLQTLGLVATGSRATLVALTAALIWLMALRQTRLVWLFGVATVLIGSLVVLLSPARSLPVTLQGRLYVWKISAPHLGEKILGQGPGSFAGLFPVWESSYWRKNQESQGEHQFKGFEDHAHNDYIEIIVERGVISLAGFLVITLSFLGLAFKQRGRADNALLVASSAGFIGLLVAAMVDFPLQRPTELFVLWTLAGIGMLEQIAVKRSTAT